MCVCGCSYNEIVKRFLWVQSERSEIKCGLLKGFKARESEGVASISYVVALLYYFVTYLFIFNIIYLNDSIKCHLMIK